jgi:flagellar basal-body rod protein FlgB
MTASMSDVALLGRVLDASSLRHRVISQNIANVNTPGYRRQEVAFEEALAGHLRDGDARGALAVRPQVVTSQSSAQRTDGNGVTLEQEMTDLNKNALLHNAAAQILSTRLAMLRSAITGR